MNTKNWLNNKYTFFEDILEHDDYYLLNFCLKEDSLDFINLCHENDISFSFKPPYGIVIKVSYLDVLIEKINNNNSTTISPKLVELYL